MSPPRSLSLPRVAFLLLLVGLSGCQAGLPEKQTTARQRDGHIARAKDTPSTVLAVARVPSVEQPVSGKDEVPYRPTEGVLVNDCKGGQTKKPVWLSRLTYSLPLCVKGKPGGVNINVGTSLVDPMDAWKGEGKSQRYYSLSRVKVQDGESSLVLAVCGGDGAMLKDGDWVVPVPSLPAVAISELREIVARLEAQEERYNETLERFKHTRDSDDKKHFQKDLERMVEAMDDQVGALRAALIATNREALRGSSDRPVPPMSQVPSNRPVTPTSPVPSIPRPSSSKPPAFPGKTPQGDIHED